MTATRPPRTMRADALRNRAKLLDAATALFAAEGTDVPLEAVARAAGVGIGTLYRHFPTKEALVEAAYRNEVARLGEAADELLRSGPADVALAAWMERFVDYTAAKRGMVGALRTIVASGADVFAETKGELRATIERLLDAGAADGTLRTDLGPEDVMRATSAIWSIPDGDDWREHALRLLGLLMDGLRHGARR
ncbi:helix-turn-helix domain-containing protein [Conexibacter stalactiti]|uniref:Helix-turn-helix domain-containing protein n=1 Tax=Conexibacter stalactiti TaxID=1940611 RepID=A0ABU4HZ58_9ACTN|nr:helix-turn-helix domain-containing protein [Conexibacter stalactiti]MDW5598585.1 helix-turn-helix domain-containing protein [Conexibacter stalactiti]MEC5039227.1 helix-turn-helix domain-containing protein [Conexibacter stalactiti]